MSLNLDTKRLVLVAACALINDQARVLLTQRPEGKAMAGLWEFPGGKVEPGETPEAALIREMREELGIFIEARQLVPLTFASYSYDGFHLLMPLYVCREWSGIIEPHEGQAFVWVSGQELRGYPMPPADEPLLPSLEQWLNGPANKLE